MALLGNLMDPSKYTSTIDEHWSAARSIHWLSNVIVSNGGGGVRRGVAFGSGQDMLCGYYINTAVLIITISRSDFRAERVKAEVVQEKGGKVKLFRGPCASTRTLCNEAEPYLVSGKSGVKGDIGREPSITWNQRDPTSAVEGERRCEAQHFNYMTFFSLKAL